MDNKVSPFLLSFFIFFLKEEEKRKDTNTVVQTVTFCD